MFSVEKRMKGSPGTMANTKYAKMVAEKKWKRLARLSQKKDASLAVEIAEACGGGRTEECRNILTDILARPEREAKVAAVKGLGTLRYDPDSQIERLRHVATSADPELAKLVQDSIEALRGYTRDKKV